MAFTHTFTGVVLCHILIVLEKLCYCISPGNFHASQARLPHAVYDPRGAEGTYAGRRAAGTQWGSAHSESHAGRWWEGMAV